jgi:hypothetical protein
MQSREGSSFLKKRTKKLSFPRHRGWRSMLAESDKSFLLLFFKKEGLAS